MSERVRAEAAEAAAEAAQAEAIAAHEAAANARDAAAATLAPTDGAAVEEGARRRRRKRPSPLTPQTDGGTPSEGDGEAADDTGVATSPEGDGEGRGAGDQTRDDVEDGPEGHAWRADIARLRCDLSSATARADAAERALAAERTGSAEVAAIERVELAREIRHLCTLVRGAADGEGGGVRGGGARDSPVGPALEEEDEVEDEEGGEEEEPRFAARGGAGGARLTRAPATPPAAAAAAATTAAAAAVAAAVADGAAGDEASGVVSAALAALSREATTLHVQLRQRGALLADREAALADAESSCRHRAARRARRVSEFVGRRGASAARTRLLARCIRAFVLNAAAHRMVADRDRFRQLLQARLTGDEQVLTPSVAGSADSHFLRLSAHADS